MVTSCRWRTEGLGLGLGNREGINLMRLGGKADKDEGLRNSLIFFVINSLQTSCDELALCT